MFVMLRKLINIETSPCDGFGRIENNNENQKIESLLNTFLTKILFENKLTKNNIQYVTLKDTLATPRQLEAILISFDRKVMIQNSIYPKNTLIKLRIFISPKTNNAALLHEQCHSSYQSSKQNSRSSGGLGNIITTICDIGDTILNIFSLFH